MNNNLPFSPYRQTENLVFISGQIGQVDGKVVSGGIEPETIQALVNLQAVLMELKLDLTSVIDVQIFLTNLAVDYDKMNEVYNNHFPDPKPTRTCVGVNALPLGASFEIKAIAKIK